MGSSGKLSFHYAQQHLLIFCKNTSVLETLAATSNALPLFFKMFLIQPPFPANAHKELDSPHPSIPASRQICKKNQPPTFKCSLLSHLCVHIFRIHSIEINGCLELCKVLREDANTDPALKELSVVKRTGITVSAGRFLWKELHWANTYCACSYVSGTRANVVPSPSGFNPIPV